MSGPNPFHKRKVKSDFQSPIRGLSGKRNGYKCANPLIIETEEGARFRGPCRKCARCIAFAKNDKAGRCAAEAMVSKDILLVTCTYADLEPFPPDKEIVRKGVVKRVIRTHYVQNLNQGAKEYRVEDWQRFLNLVKKHADRQCNGAKVRFMRVAERGGNGSKRMHWHAILFFSGPVDFEVSPTPPVVKRFGKNRPDLKGKKHDDRVWWPEWPLGHMNVQRIPIDDLGALARASRYCAKYVGKNLGNGKECHLGQSQNKALGTKYVLDVVHRTVAAGRNHVVRDYYTVDGMKFRGGQLQRFPLVGAIRDSYIAEWRQEWLRVHGKTVEIAGEVYEAEDSPRMPTSPWLLRHDADSVFPMPDRRRPTGWRKAKASPTRAVMPRYNVTGRPKTYSPYESLAGNLAKATHQRGCHGVVFVHTPNGYCCGVITLKRSGAAFYLGEHDDEPTRIHQTTRGVLALSEKEHVRIEKALARLRPSDWEPPEVYWAMRKAGFARAVQTSQAKIGDEEMPPSRLFMALRDELDPDTYAEAVAAVKQRERDRHNARRNFKEDQRWLNEIMAGGGYYDSDDCLISGDGEVMLEAMETPYQRRMAYELRKAEERQAAKAKPSASRYRREPPTPEQLAAYNEALEAAKSGAMAEFWATCERLNKETSSTAFSPPKDVVDALLGRGGRD